MTEESKTQKEKALLAFEKLWDEQVERTEKMKNAPPPKDFGSMEKIVVGICGGDGIGPILVKEAEKLLAFLLEEKIRQGKIELRQIDGLTLENRMAKGEAIPEDVLRKIKECDVLLKGPTTTPKGGTLESANVAMRRELDLYANVRPVSLPKEGIDWTFFRENTEGEYVLGSRGVEYPGKLAMDFKVTTYPGTLRIAKAAFEYAKNNGKTRVAIVTKANIMKKTDGNFSAVCHEVAKDYPGITADDYYIDIMTANLLNPAVRSSYEVFLLPNLYGDIITDEAAQIQGGVGTAGSANLGDRYAMFEAVHGSAPRMIEEGLGDYANPSSIFKATEMLLRHISCRNEADKLARAMTICGETERKLTVTGDRNGATCQAYAEYITDTLSRLL
ncbi:MAG: isocitrate/isopropylmalate family dehydrogenase [Clostridia bacterium]|nr:isocitrate/isopropylmalate family dehydrogenase [Clostridia bacterium]